MQNSSRFSFAVVIPNYNHATYLPQAIDSVLSQSIQPNAIYVIDDASTDRSVEVIRSYVQRYSHIHLLQKSTNRGAIANVNEILPQIQASHVFFLSADDYLCPGNFELAHALLSEHPEAGMCLADLLEVSPDGRQRCFSYGLSPKPAYFPPARVPGVIRGLGLIGQGFHRLDGLRQIGGFPESLRWHTDHFVCWVLAARYGLCYVPKVGGAFRKLPTSYSAQGMSGAAQPEVLANFLDYLQRPEFFDVKDALRDGHMLAIFDKGLLSSLRANRNNHYLLTPSFLTSIILRRLRGCIRHPIPREVKQWFRRRFSWLPRQSSATDPAGRGPH
jgi:glycosyltransferase involved in cell wall biosynthesis